MITIVVFFFFCEITFCFGKRTNNLVVGSWKLLPTTQGNKLQEPMNIISMGRRTTLNFVSDFSIDPKHNVNCN